MDWSHGDIAPDTGWALVDHDFYTDGVSRLPRASAVVARADPAGRKGLADFKLVGKPESTGVCKGMQAARVGDEAHRIIYHAQLGEVVAPIAPYRDFAMDVSTALASWQVWLSRDVLVWAPWALEYTIGSEAMGAAGAVDALGILQMRDWDRPRRALVDWKTGKPGKKDHVKNALYDVILRREYGIDIEALVCVYLNKSRRQATTTVLFNDMKETEMVRACAIRKATGIL